MVKIAIERDVGCVCMQGFFSWVQMLVQRMK